MVGRTGVGPSLLTVGMSGVGSSSLVIAMGGGSGGVEAESKAYILYTIASMIFGIGFGVAVLIMTGSVLAGAVVLGAGMFLGTAMGVLPFWILLVYAILAGTWVYVARSM